MHSAQRFTAHSASLPALYSAQHCTHPPASPPALHSAQHCTAPSTTLHRAQRAKTRPIAASEPSIYSAQPYTVPSATQCPALHSASLRPALHCAQCFTAPSATLRAASHSAQHCTAPPPLQHCTARSITQRPALHCTEHSEPRQGRSQQANQAYTSGGIFLSAFNGCCAQTVRVRVSLANSRTRALLFFSGSLTACDMDLCILEVLHTTML